MSDFVKLQAQAEKYFVPSRRPLFLQTRGSVWSSTWVPIAAFSAYALGIYILNLASLAPNFGRGASSLSSVLSMIVGLMISYRSGTSSDRWHEGRRIWASVTSSTRTLLATLHLTLSPRSLQTREDIEQQASVTELLNLIVGFSYALKNHLRDEDSLNDPTFCELLPKRLLLTFHSTPKLLRTISQKVDIEPEKFQRVLNDESGTPIKGPTSAGATKKGGPRNMPLFLIRQAQALLNEYRVTMAPCRGSPGSDSVLLDTPTWANCTGILKDMTDQLSQAERIRDTPIPTALGIHVQQMLVLYCLAIPPQLVELLGLWVVPTSAIVAWTFFGVNAAAEQLSDPFGTDANDLPTDKIVYNIHREYLELVGNSIQSGSSANDGVLELPATLGEKLGKAE